MKTIEQKIKDAMIEIKDLYQNDGKDDNSMSDLSCGKIQAYRQVLDWMGEELDEMAIGMKKQEEADKAKAEEEINAALSDINFDSQGNPTTLDDEMGKDAQEDK